MKNIYAAIIFILSTYAFCSEEKSYVPPEGFVPTEVTAKTIAEAVLIPIYGKILIDSEKPFKVTLVEDIWIVEGVLHQSPNSYKVGGNFEIKISKKTAEIISVSHSK